MRRNKYFTNWQFLRNNLVASYSHGVGYGGDMEIVAAAGAFIGLFGLWVVLPKVLIRR